MIGRAAVACRLAAAIPLLVALSTACSGDSTELSAGDPPRAVDPQVAKAVSRGHELFFGEALCFACHRVGEEGRMIVGPNLGVGDEMSDAVAKRSKTRRPELEPVEYIVQSILDPDAFVVDGYAKSVMKSIDALPQGAEIDDEALASIVVFLLAGGDASSVDAATLRRSQELVSKYRQEREPRPLPAASP